MSVVLALMAAAVTPATPSLSDEALMRQFIAALMTRDDKFVRANAQPTIAYDPDFRAQRVAAQLESSVEAVIRKTAHCDLGAVMRANGSVAYTINWWCKYHPAPFYSPLEGAGAALRVRNGKIEITNFSWNGPYPVPPRMAR